MIFVVVVVPLCVYAALYSIFIENNLLFTFLTNLGFRVIKNEHMRIATGKKTFSLTNSGRISIFAV
jgi:hypothetical protein